ncbi:M20 family peptidase [Celeribacter sp.]|uniref:M20 family peptidase n=1 Tax=Celeribacter sp. TaxID=1890673 RepID=UPI003A920CEF
MHVIWRVLTGLGVVISGLLAVIIFNTLRYAPEEGDLVSAASFTLGADIDAATQHLSEAVKIETISEDLTTPGFAEFVRYLETTFPKTYATLTREILPPNTPLYRWEGSDPTLAPVLLAAHYDVVPVTNDSFGRWDYPPFSGEITNGFVYGRGTLDNKGALIAIMTAVEHLIGEGFTPKRTVYLSFGGDEEVSGNGAKAVADYLLAQGVMLEWALDEGSFVLDGVVPGLDVPVASINLAEKGYMTATLIARSEGGHSSLPPNKTAVGDIARAVDRLQNHQIKGGLTGVSATFFDTLGRHFGFVQRAMFANTWLTAPLLNHVLSETNTTNAMLRTTTAPTMLSGSPKENVLATQASATINFRLHPRDTIEGVVEHIKTVIDDPDIEVIVNRDFASEASPVADVDGIGYSDVAKSIREVFGDLAFVPGLTIAATDARHYAKAAKNAYRINPFKVNGADIARFHGTNERLSIENLERGVNFYGALLLKQ